MNKKNQVKLFMMQSLIGYALNNSVITNLIKAFKNGIFSLGSIVDQVTAMGGQGQTVKGSGAAKEFNRAILNSITYNCIKAARGWAVSQNNKFLADQLNFSITRIEAISDKTIAGRAQNWYNLVNPEILNLGDWDLTAATMLSWQSAIQNYTDVYLFPHTKLEARKEETKKINLLIKDGMDLCRNILDSAAIGYKTNGNLAFYEAYRSYRLLTPVASKHGKFRILVTDELHQPIVNLLLVQDGTTNKITTDINGMATLDIIYNKNKDKNQMDLYSFTISSSTKSINTGIIEIKHNQTISRAYIMAPSGFIIPAWQPQPIAVPA